ncbi:MAG: amidohydrolase family protein, partial [Geobacteraceae bacterium]|nr:amidohydrolase family protein [Geobacteraceae bacterium]
MKLKTILQNCTLVVVALLIAIAAAELGIRWLKPVYEQASRYHLPILFHSGSPPYTQPFQIVEYADEYPEVQFIIGHFGKLIWLDSVRAAIQAVLRKEEVMRVKKGLVVAVACLGLLVAASAVVVAADDFRAGYELG